MSDPTFGISITRIDNEPRPAVWSDMSVVGLIGTAPAADAACCTALWMDMKRALSAGRGTFEVRVLYATLRNPDVPMNPMKIASTGSHGGTATKPA